MMKVTLAALLASAALYADMGAKEMLRIYKQSHPTAQNYLLEIERLDAKKAMENSAAPYQVFGTAAHAKEKHPGQDEVFEYSFGIAKNFRLPHADSRLQAVLDNEAKAALLQSRQELVESLYELLSLYHQSCLQRETIALYRQLDQQIGELIAKNRRAFELGEISKKDLLLWQLEQKKIALQLDQKELESRKKFRMLQGAFGSRLKIKRLECSDLEPFSLPTEGIDLDRLSASQVMLLKRDNNDMQSSEMWMREAEVALAYDNESDVERYNLSVALPLEFTSSYERSKAEQNRLERLQRDNALQAFKSSHEKRLQAQYITLKQHFETYERLEGSISEDAHELAELTYKAYLSGESTAIELIAIQQYVMQLLMQMQEEKVQFYSALFEYKKLQITGDEFQ